MKKLFSSNFIKKAFDGIIIGVFFILTVFIASIIYAATTYYTDLPQVSSGSVLSSSSWNNMVNYVNKAVKQDSEVLTVTGGKVGVGINSFTSDSAKLEVANGITFPTIQVNLNNANTLDDYEEGTWMPTFESVGATFTYGDQTGRYTKIGRLVYAQFYLRITAISGTTSNDVAIGGFPFPALSGLGHGSATFGYVVGLAYYPMTTIGNGATLAPLFKQGIGTTIKASDFTASNTYIVGSITYQTQ